EASAPGSVATAPAATSPATAAPAAVAPAAESTSTPPGAPKLAITGGVYSTNAAQRLLIVGGQVFNEGSEVAPGVVLEQVRPNQALLNYQGQRYTVRY
ncbi:MAG: general secretion pathway protein GspB, partial [Ramlibacter sp.]